MTVIMEGRREWKTALRKSWKIARGGPGQMLGSLIARQVLPVHLRGFGMFMLGRTDMFTSVHLKDSEERAIKQVAQELIPGESGIASIPYSVWRRMSKKNLGDEYEKHSPEELKKIRDTGGQPLTQKTDVLSGEIFNSLSRFLGAAKIEKKDGKIKIIDHYDFNDADAKQTWEQFKEDFSKATGGDTLYTAIRRLAPWRQRTGYKGFPIEIELDA